MVSKRSPNVLRSFIRSLGPNPNAATAIEGSMSVSDVVEVIDGTTGKSYFNFCDSFRFQRVSFEPDKTQISERFCYGDKAETISVLLIQPGKYPKTVEIEDSLEAMQALVGGDIEEYMPFEDEAAIICNEEGKMSGLPLNRAIYAEEGCGSGL